MAEKMSTSDGHMVKRERSKPEFRVDERDLPAIKKWEVGKKYKVHATVEMTSHSKDSDWDSPVRIGEGANKIHGARFKIHSIAEKKEEKGDE